jgi:hypothetical protein
MITTAGYFRWLGLSILSAIMYSWQTPHTLPILISLGIINIVMDIDEVLEERAK